MKKALKITLDVLLDIFLALLILISAFSVISAINEKKDGIPNCFGLCALSVQSDSMTGTFEKGDLIFCTKLKDGDTVVVGDIVSFKDVIGGETAINTHRVNRIEGDYFYTKGDNPLAKEDSTPRLRGEFLAKYNNYKWNGFGNVLDFIKQPVGFVCVIVVPIAAYITYQVIYIIRLYSKEKKTQMIEEAKSGTSDDVKDAIIREYLEKQKQLEEEQKQKSEAIENKVDEVDKKKEEAPKLTAKEKEPVKKETSKKGTAKKAASPKKVEKPVTEKKATSKKSTNTQEDKKKKSSQSKKPASSGKSKK